MKLKTLVIGGSGLFLMVFSLLLFVAILFSDEQDSGISNIHYGGVNVSAEVLAHKPMVEKYAKEYGVDSKFFKENDIHMHIPEGAVPKDGPSAGITMATAMLSAIIGREVRADVAMTGEITLRGHVLPIGGLKEKLLAAKYARIKEVLVPEKNRPDIEEMDREIIQGLNIRFVDNMKEVLGEALA